MRVFLLAVLAATLGAARPAAAQGSTAPPAPPTAGQGSIALSARPAAAEPRRLACAPIVGMVFEANGQPLMGATLLVKGTHQVYVTDAEGKFQFTDPVYENQVLAIGAAGYVTRDIPLADCSLPRLVLAKAAGARIKRTGKRTGQVVRLNNRNTNIK